MCIVGSKLEEYVPSALGVEKVELHARMREWVKVLRLSDTREVEEKEPLLTATQSALEVAYDRSPYNLLRDIRVKDGVTYESVLGVTETQVRNIHFRLTYTLHYKLPQDGKWIGFEGSTTQWMKALQTSTGRAFTVESQKKLEWMFRDLLGDQEPQFVGNSKESEPVENGAIGLSI